jgi:AcrR family transcriptional regulator
MGATTRKPAPARKRRTADEARTAILDAAERRLVESGPGGIRLQEVAADVGMSHPTVLHHFGSREALVEAVVARALESLHAGLVAAVRAAPADEEQVSGLLDRVFEVLADGGQGRAFMWLALAGYTPQRDQLRLRDVAEAVHELRRARRAGKKRMPPLEDTTFTVLLATMALLAQSVLGAQLLHGAGVGDDARAQARFRAWLARLMIEHFERE